MSRIKSLLKEYDGRIYVFLESKEIAEQFLQDAEVEGFTFGDGVRPTERDISDIYAINDDMTINFVGFVGHMAYGSAKEIGGRPLIKINYRELLEREKQA